MKRFLWLPLVFALMALAAGVSGATAAGDGGLPCGNIKGGLWNFSQDNPPSGTTYTLHGFQFTMATQPCFDRVMYTLYVQKDPTDASFVPYTSTITGETDTSVGFIPNLTDDDTQMCVYGETSVLKGNGDTRVIDRAPDTGCLTINANTSGGGVGFN